MYNKEKIVKKELFLDEGYIDNLRRIGASWFVSYYYYTLIDKNHKNWNKCETVAMRQSVFRNSKHHHDYWLKKILKMNKDLLKNNLLELSGEDVKEMAKAIIIKKQSM